MTALHCAIRDQSTTWSGTGVVVLRTPGNVDEAGRVLVLALSEPGLSAEVQDTAADDRKGSLASARSRAHSRDDALARRRRRGL